MADDITPMNLRLLGFAANAEQTLRLALRELAGNRFRVVEDEGADICVIDFTSADPDGLAWLERSGCPAIVIGGEPGSEAARLWLPKPFKVSRLVGILQRIYDANGPDGIRLDLDFLSLDELDARGNP